VRLALAPDGLVGNAAARSVHGFSAGADVALLGNGECASLTESLRLLRASSATVRLSGEGEAQLLGLASLAESSDAVPLVVADSTLQIAFPALLDLLDRPRVATSALVADPQPITTGKQLATPVRVGHDGRLIESVGTAAHAVSAPTHALVGLLRIEAADRPTAARLFRQAAQSITPAWGSDTLAIAMLALVRGGVPVQASALGPFDWARAGVQATGAAGGPWRQRLRGASRGGDGFYSTYAVRPVSRRLTAIGLARGWSPNAVTIVSLALGVIAAGLVATGQWWAWVVAAVLLQAALAIDCVDGEIARFTRRFSSLGAFLDAVGDRVKEYAVLAAVAAVAVREGAPGWPVAMAAMAAVTVRHLEDYAYEDRLAYSRRSAPDVLSLAAPRDLGPSSARTTLPEPPSLRETVAHWTKKVIHLPIAERYLLISLTLLTRRPMLVLWALFVAVCIAVVWTQGGRVARVLVGRDPTWRSVVPAADRGHLDEQLDLGPLAQLGTRLGPGPFALGLLGSAVLVVGPALALWWHRPWAGLAAAAVGSLLVGAGWRPPIHHPLGWQAPAALWAAEVLTIGVLVHHTLASTSAAGFAFLAAVAYHRYDAVYRLRDTGKPPGLWLSLPGGGTDGRLLVFLVLAAVAPSAVIPVMWAGAGVLALLYVGESIVSWRSWITSQGNGARKGAHS
jgi:phosphatidylglycerophosphate synthase